MGPHLLNVFDLLTGESHKVLADVKIYFTLDLLGILPQEVEIGDQSS